MLGWDARLKTKTVVDVVRFKYPAREYFLFEPEPLLEILF